MGIPELNKNGIFVLNILFLTHYSVLHLSSRENAMKDDKADIERQVTDLYDRIEELLKELGIKWADLARLIGLSPKTLSSMRSQKVNPSWTTIRKIATALDVSLDELTNDPYKTPELYELYWAIPREIKNPDIQGMTCKQCTTIAYVTGNPGITSFEHRIDVRREAIKSKLDDLKK
jgi:transcriptional regulator with XRE-family HTH domain